MSRRSWHVTAPCRRLLPPRACLTRPGFHCPPINADTRGAAAIDTSKLSDREFAILYKLAESGRFTPNEPV